MGKWGKRRGLTIRRLIKERRRVGGDYMDGVQVGFCKARLMMALEALAPLHGDVTMKASEARTVGTIMHTLNRLHEVVGK